MKKKREKTRLRIQTRTKAQAVGMERKSLHSRHIQKLELTSLVADGKLRIRAAKEQRMTLSLLDYTPG